MSRIINVLQKLNRDTEAEVYYVGGFVRDLVRRKKPNNIDMLIRNYPLPNLIKYLSKHGEVNKNASRYNMITFTCNGDIVRISLPYNGSKSSHHFSLKEDARYRDLTINAMYLPIDRRSKKHIIDFYTGLKDIKDRKIRAIGNIKRSIVLSPIRMLRAIAFVSWLNYKIDTNLFYAIKTLSKLLDKAQVDDIRDELVKILLSKKPSKYLKILHSTGLLYLIIPELHMCHGVDQNKQYHKHDVFTHCILACDNTDSDIVLRLSALLHDVGKLQTREEKSNDGNNDDKKVTFYSHEVVSARLAKRILKRLNFDKDIISKVAELAYLHMYNYEPDKWTDAAVRRFIRKAKISNDDLDKLNTFPLFLVRRADRLANGYPHSEVSYRQELFQQRICEIFEQSNAITINDLEIDGATLMSKFNLKEGPTVGHVLNYLLSLVLEDQKLNTIDILIDEASSYLSEALK